MNSESEANKSADSEGETETQRVYRPVNAPTDDTPTQEFAASSDQAAEPSPYSRLSVNAYSDVDATAVRPAVDDGDATSSSVNVSQGLFRDEPATKPTGEPDYDADPAFDPEEERAATRAATRAERNRALGKVERPRPEPPTVNTPIIQRPTTDKFAGSFGLFLLRLIAGAIMGVHGLQHMMDLTGTQRFIDGQTVLPRADILVWALAIGELLIALSLIFGLVTRLGGLGLVAIGGLALGFVLWGSVNPFQSGRPGFVGELELLLLGVGLLFLLVGGGRWGIDGWWRARRRIRKEEALGGPVD